MMANRVQFDGQGLHRHLSHFAAGIVEIEVHESKDNPTDL
jgi:hypothetical protein